ncbi:MAG: sulfate adenylyltransferase [Candidatus Thermoplasmatota archaeon]|nr:sulfate adenylyltransferase [Candidatus Thermoplasmatota archaeon]
MTTAHGGKLIQRYQKTNTNTLTDLPTIEITANTAEDLLNIAYGVFSPLNGFLTHEELDHILHHKRLPSDTPWTIPILLDYNPQEHPHLKEGDTILLKNTETKTTATMHIQDLYSYNKKTIAQEVYRTQDIQHPGVKMTYDLKQNFIGGPITLIHSEPRAYDNYNLTPKETRYLFKQKGWKEIVAFQTRNPPHIGHEYVQKTALTFVDGIFINPIIGKKKPGDFTDDVILASYETLMRHYYLKERSVMAILRTSMKYAGPREAIHHAIMRKNFGCTHFIVGRDHAGVGNYYGPYDAHDIFTEFPDLGIIPVFFRSFSRCTKCGSVVNDKICPHDQKYHINFSGKQIRKLLTEGKIPPEDMMRKEVAETILQYDHPFVE